MAWHAHAGWKVSHGTLSPGAFAGFELALGLLRAWVPKLLPVDAPEVHGLEITGAGLSGALVWKAGAGVGRGRAGNGGQARGCTWARFVPDAGPLNRRCAGPKSSSPCPLWGGRQGQG